MLGNKIKKFLKSLGGKFQDFAAKVGSKINLTPHLRATDHAIDPKSLLYARISDQAYKKKRVPLIDGYSYKPKLSTKEYAIYAQGKQAIMGIRGTALSFKDLKTDLAIAKGEESSNIRFKEALKKYDEIHQTYPTVIPTGHSMGGSLVKYLIKHRPIKHGYAFNMGAGKGSIRDMVLCNDPSGSVPNWCGRTEQRKILGDPISLLAGVGERNVKSYEPEGIFKAHGIKAFLGKKPEAKEKPKVALKSKVEEERGRRRRRLIPMRKKFAIM